MLAMMLQSNIPSRLPATVHTPAQCSLGVSFQAPSPFLMLLTTSGDLLHGYEPSDDLPETRGRAATPWFHPHKPLDEVRHGGAEY